MLPLTKHAIEQWLYYIFLVVLLFYVLNQVRKPTKWVGRFFVWMMNLTHSGVTDWGLKHVPIDEHFTILDVGCGEGTLTQQIVEQPDDVLLEDGELVT